MKKSLLLQLPCSYMALYGMAYAQTDRDLDNGGSWGTGGYYTPYFLKCIIRLN